MNNEQMEPEAKSSTPMMTDVVPEGNKFQMYSYMIPEIISGARIAPWKLIWETSMNQSGNEITKGSRSALPYVSNMNDNLRTTM